MSALDWTACVIAYMCGATYVIAYTCGCVISSCMTFMPLFQRHLANLCWFLSNDRKTLEQYVVLCNWPYFVDLVV